MSDAEIDRWFAENAVELIAVVDRVSAEYEVCGTLKRKAPEEYFPLKRLISGGQTGADRAALAAARQVGIPTGGTAPPGFLTTLGCDISLRDTYGLTELTPVTSIAQGLIIRSMKNVDDADVTIAFRQCDSAGTDKTIAYCNTGIWPGGAGGFGMPPRKAPQATRLKRYAGHRPCLVVTDVFLVALAARQIVEFLRKHKPDVVNVCGHRNDETAKAEGFVNAVRECLVAALRMYINKY